MLDNLKGNILEIVLGAAVILLGAAIIYMGISAVSRSVKEEDELAEANKKIEELEEEKDRKP